MPDRRAKCKDSSAHRHRKPPCPYPVDLLQPRSTPGHAAFAFPSFAESTSCMKNFLRALRYSWPYRGRLILSLICAGFAALLWSLNFAAITPVLTILTERKSLQDWVDEEIDKTQAKINKLQPVLKGLSDEDKMWEGQPEGEFRDKKRRDLA